MSINNIKFSLSTIKQAIRVHKGLMTKEHFKANITKSISSQVNTRSIDTIVTEALRIAKQHI